MSRACRYFEERFAVIQDEPRGALARRFQRHRAHCVGCATRYERFLTMERLIADSLRLDSPPLHFALPARSRSKSWIGLLVPVSFLCGLTTWLLTRRHA